MTSKTLLRRMRKSLVRNLISKSSNMFYGRSAFAPAIFTYFYDKNIYIIVIYDKIFLTQ